MTSAAIRLLFVDDHPVYCEGLLAALRRGLPGLHAQAVGSVAAALACLPGEPAFDMLVADQRLPDGEGLVLLAQARHRWPTLACVLLSGLDDAQLARRAAAIGCAGFIGKTLDPDQVIQALRRMLAGERVFPPAVVPTTPGLMFTGRQRAVLNMAARGMTTRAIAAALGIGERTAKDHLCVVYARLDASTRAEAVARAAALGLIDYAERG